MKTGPTLLLRLLMFMLFVWLAREFQALLEVDGCLDGGGRIEGVFCISEQHPAWAMASRRHYSSWFMVLGIPAVAVWLLYAVIQHLAATIRSRKTGHH